MTKSCETPAKRQNDKFYIQPVTFSCDSVEYPEISSIHDVNQFKLDAENSALTKL